MSIHSCSRRGSRAVVQNASQALGDVLALQWFVQDFPDTDRARSLMQLGSGIAAHQHDRDIRPYELQFAGKCRASKVGHRLIGQDDVEAPRRFAECLESRRARTESYGLIAEFGQNLL